MPDRIECQHKIPAYSGCVDCYHKVGDRAIHDDIIEIVRMQIGATVHGKADAGRPRFRTVEKSDEEIDSALEEIIYIAEELREKLDVWIQD